MKIREVLRLQAEGFKQRQIAVSVGCSRTTVQKCLRRARAAGIGWPLPQELDEATLQARLYPTPLMRTDPRPEPDYAKVTRELGRKHVTRRQLWREYRAQHPSGLQYTAFCVHLRQWRKTLGAEARLTLEHEPGERLFVDYSGDPGYYVDRQSGESIPGQLFVAAWGFSHKLYAEATRTQTTQDWLTAHANALEAFNCRPKVLVPDNTKAAVIKACYYDPEKNRQYADFGEHYDLAILPARSRKPRDKAKAENGVLVAQRRILGALRDAVFFSLAELNAAIKKIVEEINAEPFQKREGTRNTLFEQYERPAARPLPARRYEYAEWRDAIVHPDYHVQADKGLYSVPYTFIGQKVQVRLSARIVEILQHGKSIAVHQRAQRPWQRRTIPAHRPAEHRAYLELDYGKLLDRAQRIGLNTAAVVVKQVLNKKHLDETIRGALGILRLAEDFTPKALERACGLALQLGTYNYRAVRDLLLQSKRKAPRHAVPGTAHLMHENVRGSDYFCSKTKTTH